MQQSPLKVKLKDKLYTNIRSALVEAQASNPIYRKEEYVPYDFSKIFEKKEIGPLFKLLLIDRLNILTKENVNEENYYQIVEELELYKCFGCESTHFRNWLEQKITSTNKGLCCTNLSLKAYSTI
ncbi:hypothetical protein [Acinetobacter baumannii]|uniref:hypothetical protein n=1 Tax=Acinetobacter baumannii TaxID=470 RepID=UPI0035A047BA